jgi:hypothetical protein
MHHAVYASVVQLYQLLHRRKLKRHIHSNCSQISIWGRNFVEEFRTAGNKLHNNAVYGIVLRARLQQAVYEREAASGCIFGCNFESETNCLYYLMLMDQTCEPPSHHSSDYRFVQSQLYVSLICCGKITSGPTMPALLIYAVINNTMLNYIVHRL